MICVLIVFLCCECVVRFVYLLNECVSGVLVFMCVCCVSCGVWGAAENIGFGYSG